MNALTMFQHEAPPEPKTGPQEAAEQLLQACTSMVASAAHDLTVARQALIMAKDPNDVTSLRTRMEMIARYHGLWTRHAERVKLLAKAAGVVLDDQEDRTGEVQGGDPQGQEDR